MTLAEGYQSIQVEGTCRPQGWREGGERDRAAGEAEASACFTTSMTEYWLLLDMRGCSAACINFAKINNVTPDVVTKAPSRSLLQSCEIKTPRWTHESL